MSRTRLAILLVMIVGLGVGGWLTLRHRSPEAREAAAEALIATYCV